MSPYLNKPLSNSMSMFYFRKHSGRLTVFAWCILQCAMLAFTQKLSFQGPGALCACVREAKTTHKRFLNDTSLTGTWYMVCCRRWSGAQGHQRRQRHGWKWSSWENHRAAEQHHRPRASHFIRGSVLCCAQTPLILTAAQPNFIWFVSYQKQVLQNHKQRKQQPPLVRKKGFFSTLISVNTL